MGDAIVVNKNIAREKLDTKIDKLKSKKMPINLDQYFGSVNFKIDGLKYQVDIRNEWNQI